MAKDLLARGARSAKFSTSGNVGDKIVLRNISEEGRDETGFGEVIAVTYKERKVRPINNQVLVSRKEAASETDGGLVIVEEAKDRPSEGVVLAVSKHVKQVMVGETILFGKYSGQEVKVGGTKDNLPLLMDEDEILGVVEG